MNIFGSLMTIFDQKKFMTIFDQKKFMTIFDQKKFMTIFDQKNLSLSLYYLLPITYYLLLIT